MSFCDTCDKRLIHQFKDHELVNTCPVCKDTYPLTAEETHLAHYIHGADKDMIEANMMKIVTHDPTIQKIKQKCTNCKNEIMSVVFLGDMTTVVLCDKCNTRQPDI